MIGTQDHFALITGASSGIGYQLSRVFAENGKSVVAVARNKPRLEELKKELEGKYQITVRVLSKDLSDARIPSEIFSEVEDEGIKVDVLVNNAGYGVLGKFCETDLEKEMELIQVLISSSTYLTKLFSKRMVENRSGWIMNVASGLGLLPIPLFAVYAACESYVLHFSEALANELRGTGVSVTCLCPSPTATSFFMNANVQNTKYAKWKMLDPAEVAQAGYQALKRGKPIAMLGMRNQSLAYLMRILPRSAITKMVRSLMEDALTVVPSK